MRPSFYDSSGCARTISVRLEIRGRPEPSSADRQSHHRSYAVYEQKVNDFGDPRFDTRFKT